MNTTATNPTTPATSKPQSRRINSQNLLAGTKEILIQHADQIYRLRETRSGKLIMHK